MVRRSEDLTSNVIRLYGGTAARPRVEDEVDAMELTGALAGVVTAPEQTQSDLTPAKVKALSQDRVAASYFGGEGDHQPSLDDKRPSAFLRSRCPLCFGGQGRGDGHGGWVCLLSPIFYYLKNFLNLVSTQ